MVELKGKERSQIPTLKDMDKIIFLEAQICVVTNHANLIGDLNQFDNLFTHLSIINLLSVPVSVNCAVVGRKLHEQFFHT